MSIDLPQCNIALKCFVSIVINNSKVKVSKESKEMPHVTLDLKNKCGRETAISQSLRVIQQSNIGEREKSQLSSKNEGLSCCHPCHCLCC